MAAISTKNLQILLEKGGTTRGNLVPSAVGKEANTTITFAALTADEVKPGDVVIPTGVGFSEIEGNAYYVSEVDATAKKITLAGANTTGSNGVLGSTPKIAVIKRVNMVRLCLSQFDIGNASTSTTDVSTFCGDASLPGATTPGTITLGGYAAPDDEGLLEIIKAEADGSARALELILPGSPELSKGCFVGEVSLAGLGYTLPLNGAVGYTVTATQARKFAYRFPIATTTP